MLFCFHFATSDHLSWLVHDSVAYPCITLDTAITDHATEEMSLWLTHPKYMWSSGHPCSVPVVERPAFTRDGMPGDCRIRVSWEMSAMYRRLLIQVLSISIAIKPHYRFHASFHGALHSLYMLFFGIPIDYAFSSWMLMFARPIQPATHKTKIPYVTYGQMENIN